MSLLEKQIGKVENAKNLEVQRPAFESLITHLKAV